MKLNRLFFQSGVVFYLTALILCAVPAGAASFTASLDRDAITMGETATMSLVFEGGQPANVSIPAIPGLQLKQVGNSTQTTSDFNGHSSSVTTLLVAVTPQRAG